MLFVVGLLQQQKELDVLQISDVHGYINGLLHDKSYGDLAQVFSYYENLKEQIGNTTDTRSIYSAMVGDACDGTGLSDLTVPKCKLIYQALNEIKMFDAVILGNHDGARTETLEYIRDQDWF